ncbi:MAG: hypothetical protein ABIR98_08400 [Usitatibacter sp.]
MLAAAALGAAPVFAEKKTVCTITVNSADEKETIRARLPKGEYEFVELVEKGRPDWLRSSCQKNVQCDALVVSGHFNAGDTFYSDRLEKNEYFEVDELERASCGASCPNLFAKLKEVYLFGCESLNPDASKYASSHGESGRDRMRRLFPNVPSIYGFSGAAPVGPTAAMLLNKYFDGGVRGFATGQPSAGLLRAFSRNSMVRVAGVRDGEPLAASRKQICGFFDDRKSAAQKAEFVHGVLRSEAGAGALFDRIEKMLAAMPEAERNSPGFAQALAQVSADDASRSRYLAAMRAHPQPGKRARMIALGGTLGWLSEEQQRAELTTMIGEMLAGNAIGFAEVDLVCDLNKDRRLDGRLDGVALSASRASRTGQAAVMACLGNADAHAQVLRALAGSDEKEVQVAQSYLRHRPISEKAELRSVARDIARMPGGDPARVRALDTLARLHISDREIIDDLAHAFTQATSVNIQRAIAEVFIRSDPKVLPRGDLAAVLRDHRVRSPGGGHDLIDVLIAKLQASS